MALAIAIIQSCILAFPESTMMEIRDAIEGRGWIGAWERLVKTLGRFKDPLVSDWPLKPARDEAQLRSNVVFSTDMSHSDIQEISPHLNPGAVQVQNTSTPLDAGCDFASSLYTSHEHNSVVSLPLPENSIPHPPHSRSNDMIGDPALNASEYVHEEPFVGSRLVCEEEDSESVGFLPPVCSCLVCEEDRENDILLAFRQDGRNIVLDSSCAHITPHIVITPPVSYVDDFYTPGYNRVDPQWPCYLNVPRLSPHLFYHHSPLPSPHDESDDRDSKRFEPQSVASADESDGIRPGASLRVFNVQKLLSTVETSSTERLIFREVVDGIFRHRRKVAAFEASLSAPAACARFNEPGAGSHLEQRPFVWTDPAQPILQASRYFSGISIIESDCPFRAPHIMITDAPPHNPWISWGNRIEDQDYDYLPVYPKRQSSPLHNNSALEAVSGPIGQQSHHEYCDNFSIEVHPNHSRESHLIDTPPSLDTSGRFLMDTLELGCGPCSDHPCHNTPAVNTSEDMSAGRSVIRCETPTPCFDDEDDLPPLDDWYLPYLPVIERSNAVGA